MESQLIIEEDVRTVTKLIGDRISKLLKDRELNRIERERTAVEEQKKREEQELKNKLDEIKEQQVGSLLAVISYWIVTSNENYPLKCLFYNIQIFFQMKVATEAEQPATPQSATSKEAPQAASQRAISTSKSDHNITNTAATTTAATATNATGNISDQLVTKLYGYSINII